MKHQKLIRIVILALFALCPLIHSAFVFGNTETGEITSETIGCGGAYYCYTAQKKLNGGQTWLFVPLKKFNVLDAFKYAADDGTTFGYKGTTDIDCQLSGADGVYVMGYFWLIAGTTTRTGYLRPASHPKGRTDIPYVDNVVENPGYIYNKSGKNISGNTSDKTEFSKTVSDDYAHAIFIDSAEGGRINGKFYTPEEAEQKWTLGDFNYFCGNKEIKEVKDFSSKTNVYDAQEKVFISSGYVDGETDRRLELNAKPGQEIIVHFNHYLRNSSDTKATTNWHVTRTQSGVPSGVVFTDITDGGTSNSYSNLHGSITGTLTTQDTEEHSTPKVDTNRKVRIKLPAAEDDEEVNYSFEICETITYDKNQGGSTKGSTHACARITVTQTPIHVSFCPLATSLYTPPEAGTKDKGTTSSGSGVMSNIFTTYQAFIYAKPTDQIAWAHCYNPEAQAVRYTNETDSHPDTGNYNDNPALSDTIGDQDGIVSSDNKFSISTINSGDFTPKVGFSFSGIGFTRDGAKFEGKTGKTDEAVVYSKDGDLSYTILTGTAGDTITQKVTATETGTNSVKGHSTWTYSYTYNCSKCCTDYSKVITQGGWNNGVYTPTVYGTKDCDRTADGTGTHTDGSGNAKTFYKIDKTTSANNDASHASVYVPYNFNTAVSTSISQNHTDRGNDEIVIAGEDFTISSTVEIQMRSNSVTRGTYATEPPADTKVEIVTFYLPTYWTVPAGSTQASTTSVCNFFGTRVKKCNTVGNYGNRSAWMHEFPVYDEGKTYNFTHRVTAYNVPTGYNICTAVGISHTNSKNDTNDNGAGNVDNRWNISNPTCRAVAKIPNSQIWGGNLFTSGTVKTASTTKNILGLTFGSWDEFAIIAGGNSSKVEGMGTGASLGYQESYSSNRNNGGNSNSLFSVRTPLGFANSNCVGGTSCSSIAASGITSNSTIMNRLISRFVTSASSVSNLSHNELDLALGSSYQPVSNYRLTRTNGNTKIRNGASLVAGITHVVYVENGDLTISSNIRYDEVNGTNKYEDISQIPQFIFIVRDGNIKIEADVSRIDAWLIAEKGDIDTCYRYNIGDKNKQYKCERQLVINGPIIAQSISPKRSYGAGAQDSSGTDSVGNLTFTDQYNVTPAEIFNLPITSYLWAYNQARNNTQAYTVYTRTLAPRL